MELTTATDDREYFSLRLEPDYLLDFYADNGTLAHGHHTWLKEQHGGRGGLRGHVVMGRGLVDQAIWIMTYGA